MDAITVSSITFSSSGSSSGSAVGDGVAVGEAVAVAVAVACASSSLLSESSPLSFFPTEDFTSSSSSFKLFTLVALDDKKKSIPAEGRPFTSAANISKFMLENKRTADTAQTAVRLPVFPILLRMRTSVAYPENYYKFVTSFK